MISHLDHHNLSLSIILLWTMFKLYNMFKPTININLKFKKKNVVGVLISKHCLKYIT